MRVAIFARNHRQHLEAAARFAELEPSRAIPFRSQVVWRTVKKALDDQKTVEIYFAPNGSGGIVEYQATLIALVLDPHRGDHETEAWLAYELPETQVDGLWEDKGKVRTLYVVSHCSRLADPFPLNALRKVGDSEPISERFRYSYAIVYEYSKSEAQFFTQPEEVPNFDGLYEGARHQVSVNAYERNQQARLACIQHYGYTCQVCDMSFESVYGSRGRDYIHVHHRQALSAISKKYKVDPIADLVPVCPNCHVMLHIEDARNPTSVEQLRREFKELNC